MMFMAEMYDLRYDNEPHGSQPIFKPSCYATRPAPRLDARRRRELNRVNTLARLWKQTDPDIFNRTRSDFSPLQRHADQQY